MQSQTLRAIQIQSVVRFVQLRPPRTVSNNSKCVNRSYRSWRWQQHVLVGASGASGWNNPCVDASRLIPESSEQITSPSQAHKTAEVQCLAPLLSEAFKKPVHGLHQGNRLNVTRAGEFNGIYDRDRAAWSCWSLLLLLHSAQRPPKSRSRAELVATIASVEARRNHHLRNLPSPSTIAGEYYVEGGTLILALGVSCLFVLIRMIHWYIRATPWTVSQHVMTFPFQVILRYILHTCPNL